MTPNDFNGDGEADIYVWLMNGTSKIGESSLGGGSTDWTIQGLGDSNGDGRADILWRHTSGALYLWLMNGTSKIGEGSPGGVSTDWQSQGG